MLDDKRIKTNLGNKIKELRINKKLTQEKLGEHLGVDYRTISKLETGRTFLSCNLLVKLCNFFDVDSSYFFNNNIKYLTEDNLNCINEIKLLLPNFNSDKLKEIYNILLVMQK